MPIGLFQTAALVGLMAVTGTHLGSEEAPHSVTHPADSIGTARLAHWTAEFISSQKVGDPIRVYSLVTFDQLLIEQFRVGQIQRFALRINSDHTYLISRKPPSDNTSNNSVNYDNGWILQGDVDGRNDGSKAILYVRDDGSVGGHVFVKGVGRIIIQTTPELPYHLVYLKTGSFRID